MTYFEIFLLALALSIDACIVSFSYGITFKENRLKNSLLLAGFTGIFQGLMPCVGYFLTSFVKTFIAPYADWIIFTIFLFLGLKFILEKNEQKPCHISLACLFLIGVATSIDAFSAGITLSLKGNHIIKPAILITTITCINSLLGFKLGGKLRHLPTKVLEIIAGIILIWLGVSALI